MAEDWRVTVTLREEDHASELRQALHEHEVEEQGRDRLGDRVAVSRDGRHVFLYTDTSEAAHEAERVVRAILPAHELDADFAIDRWHPVEQRWENEGVPLPTTAAERRAEHHRLEQDEIAESEQVGAALWEVRVELDSHQDAVTLAGQLEAERESLLPGWTFSVLRRWKYLVIGADSEDQANQIAQRLSGQLPVGATIQVEPSGGMIWRATRLNPFAVFGGLGT